MPDACQELCCSQDRGVADPLAFEQACAVIAGNKEVRETRIGKVEQVCVLGIITLMSLKRPISAYDLPHPIHKFTSLIWRERTLQLGVATYSPHLIDLDLIRYNIKQSVGPSEHNPVRWAVPRNQCTDQDVCI